ncbi:MAG: MATE family efflux transporter, partial [Staphylothermus sp.]|nr:MATE family efflux transporter [Staphylothermus sp.]
IIGGAIRGAGNTRIPLFINAGCLYFTRIIPSLILVNYLGVLGPWLSMFIDVYIRGIIFLIVYTKYFDKLVRKIV